MQTDSYLFSFIFAILLLGLEPASADRPLYNASPKEQKDFSEKLPDCKACSTLVESFMLGMEKTKRGKHGGGDAAWEEEKLRSYLHSEVRFAEIHEDICAEVRRGKDQCYTLLNEHEAELEQWFTTQQDDYPDLHAWLCIAHTKKCCPKGHYGRECKPCSDCNSNGICKGDGTRKGNGKCLCSKGYAGEDCNDCAKGYYEDFRNEKTLLCTACHDACDGNICSGAGPKGCSSCKSGWRFDAEHGCRDINECVEQPGTCTRQQFCVNNEGTFTCLECDRSCDGCDGDGPDMCKKCAQDYELKDGKCQDMHGEKREKYMNITRFLTYFGLCVATCVIFQSSTYIAYAVGAAVAIYIAVSEYWLNSTNNTLPKPTFDTKQLEELFMKNL